VREAGSYTLEVQHIGYETQQRAVQVAAGHDAAVDIVMALAPVPMEGVIVEGEARRWRT
jgi:hypothetical protein